MNKEDSSPESILHGNDVFVSKILSSRLSIEESSRRGYFSDRQSGVPFKWEEEPGIPKNEPQHLNFVPPILPPPPNLKPFHEPKHASTSQIKSCFFIKPWFRTTKPKKGNQHDDDDVDEESVDESHIFSEEEDFFSSPHVSKSSLLSSTASSKGFVMLPSSRLLNFAKGIHKRLF